MRIIHTCVVLLVASWTNMPWRAATSRVLGWAPLGPAMASTRGSARCAASRRVRIDGSLCPNFTSTAKAGVQLRSARCWAPAFTWEVREKWLRRGRLGEGEAKNASADSPILDRERLKLEIGRASCRERVCQYV